jgi:hypothetical protein
VAGNCPASVFVHLTAEKAATDAALCPDMDSVLPPYRYYSNSQSNQKKRNDVDYREINQYAVDAKGTHLLPVKILPIST